MPEPIPAVKQAIVATLQADPGLQAAGVKVTRSFPGPEKLARSAVWTGTGTDREEPAGAGKPRNHDVTVELIVHARPKGATAEQAEDRAWDLVALVRAALLNGGITTAAGSPSSPFARQDGVTTADDQTYVAPEGHACEVVLEISGLVRTNT